MMLMGCGTVHVATDRIQTAVYAPAEPVSHQGEAGHAEGVESTPTSDSPLSLHALQAYAQEHAPAVRVAAAQYEVVAADGAEAQEILHDNPEVRFVARDLAPGAGDTIGYEVGVRQRFEIAGQHAIRLSLAEARRLTAESTLTEVRWALRVEVQRLFAGLSLARQRLTHAQRFVDFANAMRSIAATQVEVGESAPLVLLVADVEVAEAQSGLVEARQTERRMVHHLASVVGWPSAELPEIRGELPPVESAPGTADLLSIMAECHPSLRTRELAVLAGRERLRLARREAWPSPTVGVGFEDEAGHHAGERHQSWSVQLTMPVPIWSRNPVDRARAEAELVLADRERDEHMMRLRNEVHEAASALNAAGERVALYQDAVVPRLEENLVRLERAYQLGEVDVHQVSQTRARLLHGVAAFIDARIAYYESVARLQGLVGRELWPEESSAPVVCNRTGEQR